MFLILFPSNPIINSDLILLKIIELIVALNYYNIVIKVLVSTSQTIIFPSHEQLKSSVSLLLSARHVTSLSWPSKVAIKVFIYVFHTLIVLSFDPLYKIIPFDSNNKHKTFY